MRALLFAASLALSLGGASCASYSTCPVEITVLDHLTGAPVPAVRVGVRYAYEPIFNAPTGSAGITDNQGQVTLAIADLGSIYLQASSTRFFIRQQGFPRGLFRDGEHAPQSRDLIGTRKTLWVGDPEARRVDVRLEPLEDIE